jgi:site-specific DNA-methyltransferase (adenine-specific)
MLAEIKHRNSQHIGRSVAQLRKRRGIGQRALAALVNSHPSTVVRLESENRGRLSVLEKMLQVLGSGAYITRTHTVGVSNSYDSGVYPHSNPGVSDRFAGWETPKAFADTLQSACGVFDLDPCAASKRGAATVRVRVRFTQSDNGLALPWFGTVFMNPPYKELTAWLTKARDEIASGRSSLVVALIPARTDTAYWHDIITQANGLLLLKGRLRFSEHKNTAPFPSAIVIWGGCEEVITRLQGAFSCVRVNMQHI